jgi:hypothetical protein
MNSFRYFIILFFLAHCEFYITGVNPSGYRSTKTIQTNNIKAINTHTEIQKKYKDLTTLYTIKQRLMDENLFLISKLKEQQKVEAHQQEENNRMIIHQRKIIIKWGLIFIIPLTFLYLLQKLSIRKPSEFQPMKIDNIILNNGLIEAFEKSKNITTVVKTINNNYQNQPKTKYINFMKQIENKDINPPISISDASLTVHNLLSAIQNKIGDITNITDILNKFKGLSGLGGGFPTP